MYFSSLGGHFLKAQMQNNYEKIRCELHKGDIARRRIRSLTTINKSIRDVQDTLRHIRANSGYCKEKRESGAVFQANASPALAGNKPKRSITKLDINETQVKRKMTENVKTEVLDSVEQRTGGKREFILSIDSVDQMDAVSELNISTKSQCSVVENTLHSASPGNVGGNEEEEWSDGEIKEDRGDRGAAEWLLSDDKQMQPSRKNVIRAAKGTSSSVSETNSDLKESQIIQRQSKTCHNGAEDGAIQNTGIQRPGTKPDKSVLQSTEPQGNDPQNQSAMVCINRKPGVTEETGRSQTAPESVSCLKSLVESAPVAHRRSDSAEKSSRAKYLSSGDIRKLKIPTSLSRTERKRILQELISNCTVPTDRSILERERQRLLQEKITRFFQLLFDNDQSNDHEDCISCDD